MSARRTETAVTMELMPPGIEESMQIDMPDMQVWCDPVYITNGDNTSRLVATGEPGLVVMDGSYDFFPDNPLYPDDVIPAVWSQSMTDASGSFATPVTVTVTLQESITSAGITLYWGDTCPTDWTVSYYNGSTLVKSVDITAPVGNPYIVQGTVKGYDKVVLTFRKMEAYRYLKIAELDIGQTVVFRDDLLKAECLEECDLMGNTLPIGTLTLTVTNEDQQYNVLNPDGVYAALSPRQLLKCSVTVTEDGKETVSDMGRYYLASWESSNGPTAKLQAEDIMGVLDDIPYTHPRFIDPDAGKESAGVLFYDVLRNTAGLTDYTIDEEVDNEQVAGYIPVGTARTALQHLCIATRSAIKVNRDGSLHIYRPTVSSPSVTMTATSTETVTQHQAVQGVSVKYYTFDVVEDTTKYRYYGHVSTTWENYAIDLLHLGANGNVLIDTVKLVSFGVGDDAVLPSEISELDVRVNMVSFSGRAIEETPPESGWMLTGKRINTTEITYTLGSSTGNVISGHTLLTDSAQAYAIAQYWYSYLNTYALDISYKAVYDPEAETGESVQVMTTTGNNYPHRLTSLHIDLTGGLTAQAKGVGALVGNA